MNRFFLSITVALLGLAVAIPASFANPNRGGASRGGHRSGAGSRSHSSGNKSGHRSAGHAGGSRKSRSGQKTGRRVSGKRSKKGDKAVKKSSRKDKRAKVKPTKSKPRPSSARTSLASKRSKILGGKTPRQAYRKLPGKYKQALSLAQYAKLVKLLDQLNRRLSDAQLCSILVCLAQGTPLTETQVTCLEEFIESEENGLTEEQSECLNEGMEACGEEEDGGNG
jgi:hypothetical protein